MSDIFLAQASNGKELLILPRSQQKEKFLTSVAGRTSFLLRLVPCLKKSLANLTLVLFLAPFRLFASISEQ